jgi:predicted nucleic acid-binding protein
VFEENHRHHEASLDAFVRTKKGDAFCGGHSLAEFYAVATRLPGRNRFSGDQVMLCLEEIRERFTVVTLTADEYHDVVSEAAAGGIAGGLIYDMLLARCALKAGAEILYTWNLKHFEQLGPEISRRVKTPQS